MDIKILLFFSLFIYLCFAIKCTDPNAQNNNVLSVSIVSSVTGISTIPYTLKVGPISGDLYFFGILDNTSINQTFIQK